VSIKSKLTSPSLQSAALVALAALLLWLFFRGTDVGAIRESLTHAKPSLIVAAVLTTLVTYFLRALRWRFLLTPLGKAGLGNCFSTTVIGFMVNFLAGRLGEVARPYLLARREGFSASSTFATVFLERILDLVTVVTLIAFWLLVSPPRASSEEAISSLKLGGLLGLVAAVVALSILFVLARFPERTLRWAKKAYRILPRRLEEGAARFTETFAAGLAVLVDGTTLFWAGVMSLALWVNIAFAFWLGALALGVAFPFGDTFLVIGFLTIGVAVPTPGAVGGYHVMCALGLTMLFGTDASLAKAVALVNHAVAFLPVTLLGMVLFFRAGLSFRQVKTITSSS